MKITICGSIEFTPKIKEIADWLIGKGHIADIPLTSQRIINEELTLEEFKKEKQKNGDGSFRKIKDDVIRRYYEIIKELLSVESVKEKLGLDLDISKLPVSGSLEVSSFK